MRNDYECRENLGKMDLLLKFLCMAMWAVILFLVFNTVVMTAFGSPPSLNILKYDAASVVISGSGCSGTLICPQTVLTAAHCQTTRQRVTVRFRNGSSIEGKVIAKEENKGDGVDAAIIRLESKVIGIEPVPVASDYPPHNTEVLVYGRANASGNTKITRFRSKVDLRGDGGWLDLVGDTAAIGGESGGGAFYDGKLIGVVSRSNSDWKKRRGRPVIYGTWTGVSVTDRTYKLVTENLCRDKYCPT